MHFHQQDFSRSASCLLFLILLHASATYLIAQDLQTVLQSGGFDPSSIAWYKQPASRWEEALPVGNGRFDAYMLPDNLANLPFLIWDTPGDGGERGRIRSQKGAYNGTFQTGEKGETPATPIPLHEGAARYYRERELSQHRSPP